MDEVPRTGHFEGSAPSSDPTWMYYYDAAEHSSSTGHALYDLVIATGAEHGQAIERQRDAAAGFPAHETRSKALSGARLAIILMKTGDPDEAAHVGLGALESIHQLHSSRIRGYIDVLSESTDAHAGRPEVERLRDRLAEVA